MSELTEHFAHESEYAHFLNYKREQYPNLSELVEIKTPWAVVDEIRNGIYENITEQVEHSLAFDTMRIMAANLW